MKYYVMVGGRERVVTLENKPDGSIQATVDGRAVQVESVGYATRECTIHVDGHVVDVTVEGSPPQLGVVGSGQRTYVKVESDRMRAANKAQGGGLSAKERDVRSPMPGRVVKVLVTVGEEVAAGQAVAVVEAMKMENEVRAKKGGIVAKIPVKDGATVEGNAVLVAFE
jgi:biotin carboxyl carrier protein